MKKAAVLLFFMALSGFAACSQPGDSTGARRTPVADGRYITTAHGNHVTTPIQVATTFSGNRIVDISIGANDETGPILDTVKNLLLPRIIDAQSTGIDAITGATMSSIGVRTAVESAVKEAGGKPEEWRIAQPRPGARVVLSGYDVIVVGLGGSGMTAYVKASENVGTPQNPIYPKVFGIEWAGKIGGNSAVAGGPMSINSQHLKTLYGLEDYSNRNALLNLWLRDMQADLTPAELAELNGDMAYKVDYEPVPRYQGGAKWNLIRKLIDESGASVTWLGNDPYNFNFRKPAAFFTPGIGQIVSNYGADQWMAGPNAQYIDDDALDLHKTVMFTRAVETAKKRNPGSDYKLELRAVKLAKNGDVYTVEADYRNGVATYMISGKSVIIATGGFIGNPEMKNHHFGGNLRSEAVATEQGDGIRMAMSVGAATYNIDMPAMVHIAQVRNILRDRDPRDSADNWRPTLTSLLLKPDNLLVALNAPNTGRDQYSTLPDLRGRRFCNEAGPNGIAFDNWKAGGYFAAIYSNDEIARMKTNGAKATGTVMFMGQGAPVAPNAAITDLDGILEMGKRSGNVVTAATIEGLAAELGIPDKADALRDEITRYNSFVNAGPKIDTDYGKAANMLNFPILTEFPAGELPYERGYTAVIGAGYYYGTTGGLDVNENMEVLDANRQAILGLYAAGQDSMGVLFNLNKAYVAYGGAAQAWSITSGRIAGAHAASSFAGE